MYRQPVVERRYPMGRPLALWLKLLSPNPASAVPSSIVLGVSGQSLKTPRSKDILRLA